MHHGGVSKRLRGLAFQRELAETQTHPYPLRRKPLLETYNKQFERFSQWLWHEPAQPDPWGKRILLRTLRIAHQVINELRHGLLNLRAMSLVYTTLLSLVPLLAVSFSVLKGFGVHNQVEPLLLNLLAPLGEQGVEITNRIIGFVDNTRAMALGSLGLGILIFTVISLIQKIEDAFNHTWHVGQHRSFAQRFSSYLSVVVIGPVLVFAALGVSASLLSSTVMQGLIALPGIGWLITTLEKILPLLLITAAFTFIYMFIPNTRVKPLSALIGAMVAAVLWQSCGWLFASFVAGSSTHAAVYSAFAALILFIIWVYLGWLILLIGSCIAFHHQNPTFHEQQQIHEKLSIREKELLGLAIMREITRHHYQQSSPLDIHQLSNILAIPQELTCSLLESLQQANIISLCINDEQTTLLPSRPLDVVMLSEVLSAIREMGSANNLQQHPWYQPQIQQLDQQLNENTLLKDVTVKEFALE